MSEGPCIRCDDEIADPVLHHIALCNACAFEMQSQVIDDAIEAGIIAFDHNDHEGRAVYRSLIYESSREREARRG
jgi:hypothetical protein